MQYHVKQYGYVVGPFDDPVSNRRHAYTTPSSVVYETDDLEDALRKVEEITQDQTSRAYVVRTTDGAEYAGGVWLEAKDIGE